MITLKDVEETKRLTVLVKKFDNLSPFGKELMFSFLMGYGGITNDQTRYETVLEEIERMNGY